MKAQYKKKMTIRNTQRMKFLNWERFLNTVTDCLIRLWHMGADVISLSVAEGEKLNNVITYPS